VNLTSSGLTVFLDCSYINFEDVKILVFRFLKIDFSHELFIEWTGFHFSRLLVEIVSSIHFGKKIWSFLIKFEL